MSGLVARLCAAVAARLPVRVIEGADGSPYLSKYLLLGRAYDRDGIQVHLHRFHRGDEDRELHNHPWAWGVGVILAGGYAEERRVSGRLGRMAIEAVERRAFRPGAVNWIGPDTFHRVELLGSECWTLFVSGPVVRSWGFWSRATGDFTPWREFLRRKGLAIHEPWRTGEA